MRGQLKNISTEGSGIEEEAMTPEGRERRWSFRFLFNRNEADKANSLMPPPLKEIFLSWLPGLKRQTMIRQVLTKAKISLIGFLGSIVLRLVNLSLRWEKVGLCQNQKWWADESPSILLFWHGRQLFMPWIYLEHRSRSDSPKMSVLISEHNDGRMIAEGMRFLGIDSVPGSSSRGGVRAIYALIKRLKSNSHISITPDGPKGPANKMKNGPLIIAQRSRAAIHPAAFAAEKCWRFKSWDQMIFPKPFSRAVMIKGAPFSIIWDGNAEELDSFVAWSEDVLNQITSQADNYFKTSPATNLVPAR